MAITVKEILKYLVGTDDETQFDSIDKFKERFNDKKTGFVSRAELVDTKSEAFKEFVPNAVGLVTGKSVGALKKHLGELGFQVKSEDIKDKPIEEIIDFALSKVVGDVKTKYSDYETRVKQNATEATAEWETKYNTLQNKFSELQTLNGSLKNSYETDTAKLKGELSGEKLKNILEKKHSKSLKFKSGVTDLEKDGFMHTKINSKYKVALNEKGDDVEVMDMEGKKIPGKQAGTWMSYDDVLEHEGIAANVWSVNENARQINQSQFQNQPKNINGAPAPSTNSGNDTLRKVSSRVA